MRWWIAATDLTRVSAKDVCVRRCGDVDGVGWTGTMVTALKFAVPVGNEPHFKELLPSFLKLLADDDISVRRQAFLTLNNVLHKDFVNHVKGHLDAVMPLLYAETKVSVRLAGLTPALFCSCWRGTGFVHAHVHDMCVRA
jgi:hypothetical protein